MCNPARPGCGKGMRSRAALHLLKGVRRAHKRREMVLCMQASVMDKGAGQASWLSIVASENRICRGCTRV